MSDDHPLKTVQPNPKAVLAEETLKGVPGFLFIALFVAVVTYLFTEDPLLSAGAGVFFAILRVGGRLWVAKKKVENREYRIYTDKIEAETGLLSTNVRNVRYEDIIDVTRKQGFVEKKMGLGQVKVSTAGQSGKAIKMKDVEDHEEIYDTIQERRRQADS